MTTVSGQEGTPVAENCHLLPNTPGVFVVGNNDRIGH